MNGMCKPQGFGEGSMYSIDAPCVIGGALQSVNKAQNFAVFDNTWPWTREVSYCPACDEKVIIGAIIWHLNDQHRWSRAAIAEWVASVEPKEANEPLLIKESDEVVNA